MARTDRWHLSYFRLLSLATVAGSLAACGGGGGSSSGGGGPGPITQSDTVSLTATGVTAPVPAYTTSSVDFIVANPSSTTANNVVLSVTLGNGLLLAGVQCTASPGATCPDDPRTMTVTSLPAGGRLTYKVSLGLPAGTSGLITTSGSVTASNDQVTTNNSAQASLTAYSADLRALGTVSADKLRAGDSAEYSFTVENAGPDAARNVTLQQTVNSAQTVTNITCVASNGATCPATLGAEMTLPELPGAGTLRFSVSTVLTKDAIASISGSMKVSALGDGYFDNNLGPASARTQIATSPDTPTFVELQSDVGDFVGTIDRSGDNFSYSQSNSVIEVQATGKLLVVRIDGDENWEGSFVMPDRYDQIRPGEYVKRLDQGYLDLERGGFQFFGEARGCEQQGWFIVDNVVYTDGALSALDLRFEQHCNAQEPALRGQVHWVAGGTTHPPGPVDPPPPGLWNLAAGIAPTSGNYVYIESDPGDTVGGGRTDLFTQANAVFNVEMFASTLGIAVNGDHSYNASFRPMTPLARPEPGYYAIPQQSAGGNPAVGTIQVGGIFACGAAWGWYVIDSISFNGDVVTGVDLRFEQRCGIQTPAIRGKIHWRFNDPTQPAGPQNPPPAGLWAPPSGALPATGNVVYLESDVGDFVGQGLVRAYTPLNSVITVGGGGFVTAGNRFQLTVDGEEEWTGFFQAMDSIPDLQPGYYGNLQGFPAGNPAFGGISWYGEGRACAGTAGWFVIDSVTYSGSVLDSIVMRFEQRCGVAAALHGYIRWSAADNRLPPPPQNPPPAGLWAPPAGATPATGNYVYFQSGPDDFVGKGQTRLFTRPNTTFEVRTEGNIFSVFLQEAEFWGSYFVPMYPLTQLQVGYYGNLTEKNPATGLLAWYGDGRFCTPASAWMVVDSITYTLGSVSEIELRFEQMCKGSTTPLRGKLRWRSDSP